MNKKQLSAQSVQWAQAFKDNFIFVSFSSNMAFTSFVLTPVVLCFQNI
jgi:hypothetical protein